LFLTTEFTEVHFHAEIQQLIQKICHMDAFWGPSKKRKKK